MTRQSGNLWRRLRAQLLGRDRRSTAAPTRPLSFRPGLEQLEGRVLLATSVWSGASTLSSNWTDPGNWQGNAAPHPGDDLVFAVAANAACVNDFADGTAFHSITLTGLDDQVSAYTLSGNAIILTNGVMFQQHLNYQATLDFSKITLAGDQIFRSDDISFGSYIKSPLDLQGFTLTVGGIEFDGIISGSGGLVVNGPGGIVVTANNTYNGLTTINQGAVLTTLSPWGLGSAYSGTIVNPGGELDWAYPRGPNVSIAEQMFEPLTLSGAGVYQQGAFVVSLPIPAQEYAKISLNGDASIRVGDMISGLPYQADMAFENGMNTNGFTLTLNGTIPALIHHAITGGGTVVQNGQQLTGTGTIDGALQVNQGTLTPGDQGTGSFTTGPLFFGPAATLQVSINSPPAGAGYAPLKVNGPVNLGGSTLSATLNYTPAPGTSFPIIQSTGVISGAFAGMPEGSIVKLNGQPYQIRYVNGPTGGQVLLTTPSFIATGADQGGGPDVRIFGPAGVMVNEIVAYNPAFTGGVRVAVADVTGDLIPDIITAPGPSGGPDIRVFDGQTGALIREFFAYNIGFTGGVNVATADLNGDGKAEIITAADATGGPDIRIFDGATGVMIREIIAYNPAFTGGVRLAVGDIDHDGIPDIITSPGIGGGPDIRVFSGGTGAMIREIIAYNPTFTGGVYVAAADLDHDGHAEIITSPGVGGGPDVRIFAGSTGAWIGQFEAYAPGFTGGVRVAAVDVNLDGTPDIITSPGVGGGPDVRAFDGTTFGQVDEFFAYNPAFTGGVYVGGK